MQQKGEIFESRKWSTRRGRGQINDVQNSRCLRFVNNPNSVGNCPPTYVRAAGDEKVNKY